MEKEPNAKGVKYLNVNEDAVDHPENMTLDDFFNDLDDYKPPEDTEYLIVTVYFVLKNGERYGCKQVIENLFVYPGFGSILRARLEHALKNNRFDKRIFPPSLYKFDEQMKKTIVKTRYRDLTLENDEWDKWHGVRISVLCAVPDWR
jgi:hypothetical protein